MPAVDPQGGQAYWFDGESFDAIQKATTPPDPNEQKYWFNGNAFDPIFGPAAGGGGGGPITSVFDVLSLAP